MKLVTALFAALCASLALGIESDRVEVQIGVSRSGLPANTRIAVSLRGARDVELASGAGTFSTAVSPGRHSRIQIRLNRPVEQRDIQSVAAVVGVGRRSYSIKQFTILLGPSYPRTVLVDSILTPMWNGESRSFQTAVSDERVLRFDGFSMSCTVRDSANYSNDVEVWLELLNGKTYVFETAGKLRPAGGTDVNLYWNLPEPVFRYDIKRIRVYSGRAKSWRVLSFTELFLETDDVRLSDVKFEGSYSGKVNGILDRSTILLQDHRLWESPALSAGADTYSPDVKANWFNVYLFTGNDDLRWDPNVQPNMEVVINLYLKRATVPVRIVARSLNPHAPFANGGVWGGSFAGYDIAERIAPWRADMPAPSIYDIEAIEVETVRGWDGSTPTRGIIRGQGDPFRQPDTWSFRGIWVGAASDLRDRISPEQPLAHWTTLLCDFSRNRPMREGQKVRFPVRITSRRPLIPIDK